MLVYIYIYGRYKQVVYNNTIWRMRFACWVTKAADARLEYVMFTAFPLQQWLHKPASDLRYTYTLYTAGLVDDCDHNTGCKELNNKIVGE